MGLTKVLGQLLVVKPRLFQVSELVNPRPDVCFDELDAGTRHLDVLSLALQTDVLGQHDRLVKLSLKEGNDLSADTRVGVGHAGLKMIEKVGLD